MSDKRNARPAGGTAERAKETAAFSGAVISCNHSITDGAERQPGFIAGLLSHGAENGMTLSDLHRLTGKDKRVIRAEIQQERLSGTPILSDNLNGYFLPANEDERERCVKSLRHRAGEILKSAAAIERAAGLTQRGPMPLDGQCDLFGSDDR